MAADRRAVVFLGAYAWEVLTNAQGGAKNAAEMVIDAVWALFGVDYLVRLALAPNRGTGSSTTYPTWRSSPCRSCDHCGSCAW